MGRDLANHAHQEDFRVSPFFKALTVTYAHLENSQTKKDRILANNALTDGVTSLLEIVVRHVSWTIL